MVNAELLQQVLGLPREELRALYAQIGDELDSGEAPAVNADHEAELDRRLADIEANPAAQDSWENVLARLRARK
jgi:putative addiction module component (TIGR02574 family)